MKHTIKMNRSDEISEINDTNDNPDPRKKPRATGTAVWAATFVAFSGLWHYGFSVGSSNAAYLPITKFIREEYEERYQTNSTSEVVEALWVTSSTVFPVGGLFGTFLIGPLTRRFGRRMSILLGHIIIVFLSIFLGLSATFRLPEMIIVTRFGIGVVCGAVGTAICPMYIAEISPLHVRGIFGSMVGTALTFGILSANVVGLPKALGNDILWPVLMAVVGVPSLFFIVLYKLLPESPRKLFLEDGNTEKSIEVLRKLNGIKNVNHILDEMQEEEKAAQSIRQMSVIEVLRSSSLRLPLIIAVFIASAQQITGINGVTVNMNRAFLNAGLPLAYAPYASVGVTGAGVVSNFICMFTTDKYGRRKPLIIGYSLQAFCLFLLTISTELQYLSQAFSYVAVISSLGFYCAFSYGAGPVTHLIVPELFNQASRSAAMMLSSVVLWGSFALCVFVTPYMLTAIRGYTFLPYCILSLISAIFLAFKVPETKNKTFVTILNSLRGQNVAKNKV